MFRLNDDYTRQTIPEEGSGSHWTTGDIALHISLHSAFQWCARLDQAEDIPNPLPPMAAEHGLISISDSAPERGARGSCQAGRCNARASLLLLPLLDARATQGRSPRSAFGGPSPRRT